MKALHVPKYWYRALVFKVPKMIASLYNYWYNPHNERTSTSMYRGTLLRISSNPYLIINVTMPISDNNIPGYQNSAPKTGGY